MRKSSPALKIEMTLVLVLTTCQVSSRMMSAFIFLESGRNEQLVIKNPLFDWRVESVGYRRSADMKQCLMYVKRNQREPPTSKAASEFGQIHPQTTG